MFVYCMNDPVSLVDYSGDAAVMAILIGCVAGSAIGAAFGAMTALATGQDVKKAAISGAVNGLICAIPFKTELAVAAVAVSAAKAAVAMQYEYHLQQKSGNSDVDYSSIVTTGSSMFVGSMVGCAMPMYLDGKTLHNFGVIVGNMVGSLHVAGIEMLSRMFDYEISNHSKDIVEEYSAPTGKTTGNYRVDRLM